MNVFLDANISSRLVKSLADLFDSILHVKDIGLEDATDTETWLWAKTHDYMICTKDSDFYYRAILYAPPKVIWLKLGNCTTGEIIACLREQYERLQQFQADEDQVVLVLEN